MYYYKTARVDLRFASFGTEYGVPGKVVYVRAGTTLAVELWSGSPAHKSTRQGWDP